MSRTALPLLVAISLLLGACQTELYQGLNQRDANEMVAALARAGIEATREQVDPTTYRIMVPEDALPAAVEALKRVGLPRESYQSLGEIFPGDGLIVSPYEQRIRTMHALNQEIARTITSISGVMSARIHIVLPDLDLRGLPMNKPSASVLVHHAPHLDISELATRVRLLVANAVQGMNFRDVAVSFFPVGVEIDEPIMAAAQANLPAPAPATAASAARPPVEPAVRGEAETKPALVAGVFGYASSILWLLAIGMVAAAVGMMARDRARRRVRRSA
ncbi:MAG TPA: type III secretion inner membrane ring lipoprotein SctJ [Saliniramus sp.]|nr:type III secretion inner membrane ring lipoprotein SctJ [Saliniramus sp.]